MGLWNLYFIYKLLFALGGTLQFHLGWNLLLALFLILPSFHWFLSSLRFVLALLAATLLLYSELPLPPLARAWSQIENLQGFSWIYVQELLGRVISWEVSVAALVILLLYLVLNRWLRITSFVLVAIVVTPLWQWQQKATVLPVATQATPTQTTAIKTPTQSPAELLTAFQQQEAKRVVDLTQLGQKPAFDVILLHICSLAWDDLRFAKQDKHPLWQQFDVVFEQFSTGASYSGPAAIRVLRAACGQQEHTALYQAAPQQCYLFQQLQQLGLQPYALMNHDGHFDNFFELVSQNLAVPGLKPVMPTTAAVAMRGFDDSPILSDRQVLFNWFNQRTKEAPPAALYYNTISLHDGNRLPNSSLSSLQSYPQRLNTLLTDVQAFIQLIAASQRPAVVMFVPEHGAAVEGDELQMAGLREIPSPGIVRVPVGVKLVNFPQTQPQAPVLVKEPSSYLALVKLLENTIKNHALQTGLQNASLTADLPQTALVAQNEQTIVMADPNDKRYHMRTPDGVWVTAESKK